MARPAASFINETLASLAHSYLEPWRRAGGGVTLPAVDDAHLHWADYRDPSWGGYVPLGEAHNRLLRVNIINGQLHFVNSVGSKSLRRAVRQRAVLRLLQTVLDVHALPDVDFVLSVSDRPTVPKNALALAAAAEATEDATNAATGQRGPSPPRPRRRRLAAPPPVFGYAATASHYTLPFPPISFEPARWKALHASLESHPPLAGRVKAALWRGTCNSLCDMMKSRRCKLPRDAALLPRLQLLTVASRCPHECDVGITSTHKNCAGFAPKPAVPISAHAKHALLLHVDGNGFSGRLDELLTLGAVVLKQDSPFYAYYYPLLRRGVHYEPVSRNLSDLCPKARALLHGIGSDPGGRSRAERIAGAAARFTRRYLSPEAVGVYVAELLRQYAALQRFTPRLHAQAVRWGRDPEAAAHQASSSARARPPRMLGSDAAKAGGQAPRAARAAATSVCRAGGDELCCRRHPRACQRRP